MALRVEEVVLDELVEVIELARGLVLLRDDDMVGGAVRVACALGMSGDLTKLFGKLNKVGIEVFAMSDSQVETDFQTLGNGWADSDHWFIDRNKKQKFTEPVNIGQMMVEHKINGKPSSKPTSTLDKDYLVNQRFVALLSFEDDGFANEVAEALQHPVWQMYIGRKKCIPCGDVFYGLFDSKDEAMKAVGELNPKFKYTEDEPDDYIDEFCVRDIPTTEFCKYDTYAHRRVYKSAFVA